MRILFVFSLLTMTYTAVGHASSTPVDIKIECKHYLHQDEEFDIVSNGHFLASITNNERASSGKGVIPFYKFKEAYELNGSNEIEIQYIKNDKLISSFNIEKNEDGKINGTYYFDGKKFSDKK